MGLEPQAGLRGAQARVQEDHPPPDLGDGYVDGQGGRLGGADEAAGDPVPLDGRDVDDLEGSVFKGSQVERDSFGDDTLRHQSTHHRAHPGHVEYLVDLKLGRFLL